MSKESFKQILFNFGVTEEKLALTTVQMLESDNDKVKVAAFNKVWKLFDLEDKQIQVSSNNILEAMGMDQLMMTVQERRRLGTSAQEAEVVDDD